MWSQCEKARRLLEVLNDAKSRYGILHFGQKMKKYLPTKIIEKKNVNDEMKNAISSIINYIDVLTNIALQLLLYVENWKMILPGEYDTANLY